MTTNRRRRALWLGLVASLVTLGCKSAPSATALDITVLTEAALAPKLTQVTVTVDAQKRTDLSQQITPVSTSLKWTVRVDNPGAGFPVLVSATGIGSLTVTTSALVDVKPGETIPVTLSFTENCAGASAPVCTSTQMCANGTCVDRPVLPATDGGVDGGAGGKAGAGGKGGAGGKAGAGGATGTGGAAATGGTVGTGGHDAGTVTVECDAGTHNCAGMGCVANDSVAHCGGMCGACMAPDGGTAVCGDAGACDFTCGALEKCATGCGACCTNSDCPQQNGKSGSCDTSTRTCNYTVCASGFKSCGTGCIPTGNCCASSECGTCQSCTNGTCAAVLSHDDPVPSRCAGTCDSAGACKSKLGQTCNTVPLPGGGCISGTFCAPDGYCCNSACTGSCVACDLQGFQGTCTNIGANTTPHSGHSSCAGVGTTCAGSCDGSGACVYGTGSCGNGPTCSGSGYVGQSTCDNGSCLTPGAQVCTGNLVCSQNACKTACTADADCLNGYFCESGSCHLGAVAVTAGDVHACALLSDGSVHCWGYNYYGQLGNGQSSDNGLTQSSTPVTAILPGPATIVSASGEATCALLKTGAVYCWGTGNHGQLGYGALPTTNSGGLSTPVKVSLSGTASYVSVNYGGACAVSGGSAWCWGRNVEGELGNGVFGNSAPYGSLSPVQVMGNSFPAPTFLSGGYYHFCAGSSSVWCWGDDSYGQLGNNTFDDANGYGYATPQSLYFSYPSSVTALASGFYFSCGLLSGGSVYCWGNNNSGQLGTGSFSAVSPYGIDTPVQVTGTISAPTAITAGGYHACALLASGSVSCWGGNQYGELGTGTATSGSPYGIASAKAVVGLGSTATAVAAGTNFTCAVLKNGSVWCWGVNTYGVLGNDSGAQSVSPLQIPGW